MMHPDDHALFGDFPGSDTDLATCEALLIQRWPIKERFKEPGLMGQKWFDYRPLHPVIATYLFAHMLNQRMRKIIRETLDDSAPRVAANGTVVDWEVIKAGDIFEPPARLASRSFWERKLAGVIRARQAADADGIPYEVFINTALHHFYLGAGSYVLGRTESKVITPNLLYGDEVLALIRATWLEQIRIKVQEAKHPRYRDPDEHPDHLQHRHWLIQQLEARAVREHAAARLVKAGLLRLDDVLGRVTDAGLLRRLVAA